MAEGLANSGIAGCSHVEVRTVETYFNSVFFKLGIYPDAEEHRGVRAGLAYLSSNGRTRP
jgi:DNA-binding NarL/FixJ family response regulator